MKFFLSFLILSLFAADSFSQGKLQAFPLSSVRLLDGPFKQAQETDLKYILALDPDRLLAPYLKEAGIDTKVKSYPNWENTGLDGHIGGHYLSALANMVASTGNQEVKRRLDYMIDWLDSCQKKNGDGYVGGVPGGKVIWEAISKGNIKAASFSLNNKWVPLYNIHKTYAGLRDAYSVGGSEKAKKVLIRFCDWFVTLTSGLSEEQFQDMLRSEHGGLNEIFADVADITGNRTYLDVARKLSHQRILTPLLQSRDSLTGMHANTQIPKVIGFKRISELTGDSSWNQAASFFWNTVVHHRTVSIGGNSVREHFHPAQDFSSMLESVEGPETCNSYNMLRLTRALHLTQPSASYVDYYERTLYNHILSSQHPQGGFVYFTPMRPRHYRVYSQASESFWCCVGSGVENHSKYGELIYTHNGKDVFVNLFIASKLNWKEGEIELVQQTSFPFQAQSRIQVKVSKPQKFSLYFRQPGWLKGGEMKVMVNNKSWKVVPDASGYVRVERTWKSGDEILLMLPMEIQTVGMPDQSPWVSFSYGPIVLAATTDHKDLVGLKADSSRMGHIAHGPLYPIDEAPMMISASVEAVPAFVKPVAGKPLHFKATQLVYPAKYKELELQPFFQIHDARYMIYWRVADKESLAKLQQELREKEKAKLVLEANTVDKVAPGEQQPENDHRFQDEKSESGVVKEMHWRNAAGWFSYVLKNKDRSVKKLRITYYGGERNSGFDIYINNRLFKTVVLDGSGGDKFIDVDYDLDEQWTNGSDGTIELKFSAKPDSRTARIFSVRLMR